MQSAYFIIFLIIAIVSMGYLGMRMRYGVGSFSLVDAIVVTMVVAATGVAAKPVFDSWQTQMQESALLQNLHQLRNRIELYKVQHDGRVPILHEGSLPQLTHKTNILGELGSDQKKYRLGPYLPGGIPVNPCSDRSIVTATKVFPPKEPSGVGGWLYHQPTGQIVPDLEGFLEK